MTAELGRQPWLIYGLFQTHDGYSKVVSNGNTIFTLIGFTGLYFVLGVLFLYLVGREIGHGPDAETATSSMQDQEDALPTGAVRKKRGALCMITDMVRHRQLHAHRLWLGGRNFGAGMLTGMCQNARNDAGHLRRSDPLVVA